MLDRLLIPLHGNESLKTVSALLEFSQRFSSQHVTFLHVGKETNAAHERIKPFKDSALSLNMTCELVFKSGHVATAICNGVDETNSDIICFAWKGKTILERTLLGSVSKDVIRLTEYPVFIYKKRLQYFSNNTKLSSILYATNLTSSETEIMPYLAYKGLHAEKLFIMNVGTRAPDPEAEEKRESYVQFYLDQLKQEFEKSYKTVETIVEIGSPRKKIVKQAKKNKVDLVVIGRKVDENFGDAILGSTAEYLPHNLACSIMIIPGGKKFTS